MTFEEVFGGLFNVIESDNPEIKAADNAITDAKKRKARATIKTTTDKLHNQQRHLADLTSKTDGGILS